MGTLGYVLAQVVLALVYLAGSLSEDGYPFHWPLVQQHFGLLFVLGEMLVIAGGFWEGLSGRSGSRRLIVCGVGVAILVVAVPLSTLLSGLSGGLHGLIQLLVPLLPAVMQAVVVFAPSWLAVLTGRALRRRLGHAVQDAG